MRKQPVKGKRTSPPRRRPRSVPALPAETLYLLIGAPLLGVVSASAGPLGKLGQPLSLFLAMLLVIQAGWRARTWASLVFEKKVTLCWQLLLAWGLITVARGTTLDKYGLYMWGGGVYALAWMVPFCMPLGANPKTWRRIGKICAFAVTAGAILWVLSFLSGRHIHFGLTTSGPYLAVLSLYMPERWRKPIWAGATVCLFNAVLEVGRSLVLANGMMILAGMWIAFFKQGRKHLYRRASVLATLSAVVLAICYVASVDTVPFVGQRVNAQIASFKDELPRNTRISGEHNLYVDFFADMNAVSLIAGRGCMGTYKGWYGKRGIGWKDRRNVECGYLQTILKGGGIMLVLMVVLMTSATWMGLRHSRNWFTRGCACIVAVRLVEMVPFGLPNANIRYILVWLAVGACLSPGLRQMSENEIRDFLLPAKTPRAKQRRGSQSAEDGA